MTGTLILYNGYLVAYLGCKIFKVKKISLNNNKRLCYICNSKTSWETRIFSKMECHHKIQEQDNHEESFRQLLQEVQLSNQISRTILSNTQALIKRHPLKEGSKKH